MYGEPCMAVRSSYGTGRCDNIMQGLGPYSTDMSRVPLNTWYHLTSVMSGRISRIYVNSNLTAESTVPMTPLGKDVKSAVQIGSASSNVAIDELKFYNRALSTAQILIDYQTNEWAIYSKSRNSFLNKI